MPPGAKDQKKAAPASRRKKKDVQVVALDKNASTLLPTAQRESLIAWFNLYMAIEAGDPTSNTFKAKAADLTRFMEYFTSASGSDHPDQWTPSISKRFISKMLKTKSTSTGKTFAPSTINRVLATLRIASKWIHNQRPFLAGYPMEKVTDIHTPDPEWRGLSDIEVTRLLSASEQLIAINTKSQQTAVRDRAILLILLGTALRVSELANLDLDQYDEKHFLRVRRKGNNITPKVFIPQDAREALERYIDEVRGDEKGALIMSKSGKRMAIQNISSALKRIAKQANAKIAKKEAIDLSPHDLRHTALRKMAEKKGIRYAQQMAGHASSHYIWRYVQPGSSALEEAVEGLYD